MARLAASETKLAAITAERDRLRRAYQLLLEHYELSDYGAYFRLLASGQAPGEVQTAVDALTTNETYFFREPRHFDQLRKLALAAGPRTQPCHLEQARHGGRRLAVPVEQLLAPLLDSVDQVLEARQVAPGRIAGPPPALDDRRVRHCVSIPR